MSSHKKLKKRPYPPPSYRPPPVPAAELSFIAHSPPSPQAEYSNFPYSFYNYVPMNQEDRRRSRSRTRSSLSLTSIPTTKTRPATVLTMNSTTPLLNVGNGAQSRSDIMPSRKLTKPRKPAAAQSSDFATLPYVELAATSPSLPLPPSPSHIQIMPNYHEPPQDPLPKRRSTMNWKVTWSLRRRNTGKDKEREISPKVEDSDEVLGISPDVSPLQTLPMTTQTFMPPLTPPPSKKFTLSPELDSDSDMEDYSHSRAEHDLDSSLDHDFLHSRARPRTPVHSGFNSSNGHYDHFTHAHRRNSAPISRRWTLAMAMTNHELSDENFVQQVELMRRASVTQFSDEVDESYYYHGSSYDHDYDENETFEDASTTYHHSHSQVHGHGQVPSIPDLRIRVPSAPFPASPSPTSPTAPFSPSTSAPESHMMYAPLPFDPPAADRDWSSALHALLITRDLLRTERNYLASLMLLLDSSPCGTPMSPNSSEGAMNGFFDPSSNSHVPNHSHPLNHFPSPEPIELRTTLLWPIYPPPLLMHTYLCSLIATSSMLLAKFEADPSVMGAANALVSSEEEVERVFVGWCGVVGGWFEDKHRRKSYGGKEPSERRRRLSKTKFTESASASSSVAGSRSVSMVFSTPPPMPDLPSPSRPMSQISSTSPSRPISQRIPSLRPLSVLYPPSSPAEGIKTAPLPSRRAMDLSRSRLNKEETPLPPIPVEDERGRQPPPSVNGHTSLQVPIIPNSEDQEGEVVFPSINGRDTSVSTRDSNSSTPLRSPSTGLLGLVVSRFASSSSLAGGKDKDKVARKLSQNKSRSKGHEEEEDEFKNKGKMERSRSVLLFGSRSRTHPPLPDRARTSPSSALKRSVSDYWKRSRGSRSRVPSSNAIQNDLPVSSVIEDNGAPAIVHLNGDTNGNNSSNNTSTSGHGTDEGFYSECGGGMASTVDGHGYTSPVDGHGLKEKKAVNGAPDTSPRRPGGGLIGVGSKRVYSVRDLAILPVQRVTRYTLIYRDLLKHTPATSPARPLLEHAIEVSRRIAMKCDKAQGNAELLRRR